MSSKKVVEYHIARLKDKRASVRLDAIHQLELLGASEALEVLRQVFHEDDDKEVRRAAQEAGRNIFRKVNGSTTK